MKYRCVTTFSPKGYKAYGKKFLETYTEHWSVPLYVYYEGNKPDFKHKLIKYYSLDADRERAAFIKRNEGREVPKVDPGNQYRYDWKRFCHKIFALTNPRNAKDTDWLIWLDADIITLDTVDEAFLKEVCQDDISYVGRDEFTHPDCAFVAYRDKRFLEAFRTTYVSDALFSAPEWHDSFIFMTGLQTFKVKAHNLSPGIPGMHVFDACILGTKMRHLKGPLRKKGMPVPQGAYAGVPVTAKGMRRVQIKTKNCVPHVNIQANIHYNVTLLEHWAVPCRRIKTELIFCSGGPSLEQYFKKIKQHQKKGDKIAVVKHAHNRLIEQGIIPDFCVLLDPRSHVRDFIENPHPDVLYVVASMVHPSTLDMLIEKKANVLGYHAHVGAEEDKVLSLRGLNGVLIGGGCSAAMRGISVFHTLGFCSFHLYGYDLCFEEKPFKGKKPPHKADGTPEYLEVTVFGRKFWTDPEKIAQAQDFEKMMKEPQNRIDIEAHGPGMIPHIWASGFKPLPRFEDLIGTARLASGIAEPRAEPEKS